MERITALLVVLAAHVQGWDHDSVLLRDVQVLTLHKGQFTRGRRSSPIPQLQCIGGSAGCHAFNPEVVQCQNKGWDGVDVQWECKTNMESMYRFGRIEVSCEGYSHPSDDYILKGSCGLEYSLEFTEGGRTNTQGSSGTHRGSNGFGGLWGSAFGGSSGDKQQSTHHSQSGDSGGLVVVVLLLLFAYGVYKLFLSGNTAQSRQDGEQTGYPGHHDFTRGPPPPGFKPHFTDNPGANPGYGFHSDVHGRQFSGGQAFPGTGGGFWTGMGTGGVLGYLFGRQRNQQNHFTRYNNSQPPSHSSSSSSGVRTASGFGGTKRR